uniref:Ferredoxin n=1 Tax=Apophlaea sinclairii TaxID=212746 RepID=A0A1C9CBT1_9FLOR|nr:ferredoxin [Apophlaea sinclairii]AOM65850.1 ferredoxin [Apophlaea sinclairii]
MAEYKVKLVHEDETIEITCPDDSFILDVAEEQGYSLPYSCRQVLVLLVLAKIVDGTIDQEEQSFLDDDQVNEGYVLTCVAYATSDCTILTHQEDVLY